MRGGANSQSPDGGRHDEASVNTHARARTQRHTHRRAQTTQTISHKHADARRHTHMHASRHIHTTDIRMDSITHASLTLSPYSKDFLVT